MTHSKSLRKTSRHKKRPTVSSAKHWYGSSVDQQKIHCVPWRIGRLGVGGCISPDEDHEIDDGRSPECSPVAFLPVASPDLRHWVWIDCAAFWATDRLNDANSNKSRKVRNHWVTGPRRDGCRLQGHGPGHRAHRRRKK